MARFSCSIGSDVVRTTRLGTSMPKNGAHLSRSVFKNSQNLTAGAATGGRRAGQQRHVLNRPADEGRR